MEDGRETREAFDCLPSVESISEAAGFASVEEAVLECIALLKRLVST